MLELYFSHTENISPELQNYISRMMRGLYSSNDIDIIVRKINSSGQDDNIQNIATEIRNLMVDIVSNYLDNPTTTIGTIEVNNVLKISSLKMSDSKKTIDPVIDIDPVRHLVNDSLTQPYIQTIDRLLAIPPDKRRPQDIKNYYTAYNAIGRLEAQDKINQNALLSEEGKIIRQYNDPTTNMQQITLDIGTTDLVPMYVFYNLFPTTLNEKLFFYMKFLITGEEFLSDKFKRSILAILSYKFLINTQDIRSADFIKFVIEELNDAFKTMKIPFNLSQIVKNALYNDGIKQSIKITELYAQINGSVSTKVGGP